MRGADFDQGAMWSYIMPEQRIPFEHPLRPIRKMVDAVLKELSPQFAQLYAQTGRPSIPPEQLLRALVLQMMYSVRSERLLMEELNYNLLFRWFVGLSMDDAVWDATTFSKNRERLLNGEIHQVFFSQVLALAERSGCLSDEHFTVDGTLIEAWASHKSFRKKQEVPTRRDEDRDPRGGNPTVDFRGEQRSNATHESTSDPDARLLKKASGQESKLGYHGHLLMENRHGLAVAAGLTIGSGTAEREAALEMIQAHRGGRRCTLGADKNYDVRAFVAQLRAHQVTPHVAQNNTRRKSAIDARTTHHAGYEISQKKRKRIEEIFGWLKTIALVRKVRHRGRERVGAVFVWATAIYNLVRLRNLGVATA